MTSAFVARMWVKSSAGRYSVTIRGHLTARDLGRLERACGPALEQKRAPLTVRLAADNRMDQPAKIYLDRLVDRGAVVIVE